MKCSLAYPKILSSLEAPTKLCIAFEKYDGTNLHWVWDPELGWFAFGVRRDRFDLDEVGIAAFNAAHPGCEEASNIFQSFYAENIAEVFQKCEPYCKAKELVAFTEFLGPNSFAGKHKADDVKQLVLFDVQCDNQIIGPEQFVHDFGHLSIARVVYKGKLTGQFTEDARKGKYKVPEGVVCKGGTGESLWMIKIKTNEYKQRLKQAFADKWEDYWE